MVVAGVPSVMNKRFGGNSSGGMVELLVHHSFTREEEDINTYQ